MDRIFQGRIEPVVDSVFPAGQAREAYTRYERSEQLGEIVLKVGE